MRRLLLGAIFLVSVSSMVAALVVYSWAKDPRPSAKASDDPFGDSAPTPARPRAANAGTKPDQPDNPFSQPDDAPPPGLRPYPPTPRTPRADHVSQAVGVAGVSIATPPQIAVDRILTPEMAISSEPPAPVDAVSALESAAIAKIDAALASMTEINCKNLPLADLVAQLKKRHKIEIDLDLAGLKDAGVDPNVPVTEHLSGISLRSALRILAERLNLAYAIHDEVLLITSPAKAESDDFLLTRLYPVKDLVLVRTEDGQIGVEFQPLSDLITNTVAQKSWLDNGGTGSMNCYQFQDRCLLVISQTQAVHEQIGDFLAALRRFGNAPPASAKDLRLPQLPKVMPPLSYPAAPAKPQPVAVPAQATSPKPAPAPQQPQPTSGSASPPQNAPRGLVRILTPEMAATREPAELDFDTLSPIEKKILAALKSPTEIDCDKMPLGRLVEQLKKRHKIEIQLDIPGLKEAGVDADTLITKHLSGISLGAALRLVLDELQCKYVIHNEVLLITSPSKSVSDDFMTTKFYPVKDLILVKNDRGEIETDFQSLIDLIQNTIEQKSWLDNGGTGQIIAYPFHDRCLLVISQDDEVHEEIGYLLAALRHAATTDAKKEGELRLPQLPKASSPGAAPAVQGGGFF